jgi:hypothetical protein
MSKLLLERPPLALSPLRRLPARVFSSKAQRASRSLRDFLPVPCFPPLHLLPSPSPPTPHKQSMADILVYGIAYLCSNAKTAYHETRSPLLPLCDLSSSPDDSSATTTEWALRKLHHGWATRQTALYLRAAVLVDAKYVPGRFVPSESGDLGERMLNLLLSLLSSCPFLPPFDCDERLVGLRGIRCVSLFLFPLSLRLRRRKRDADLSRPPASTFPYPPSPSARQLSPPSQACWAGVVNRDTLLATREAVVEADWVTSRLAAAIEWCEEKQLGKTKLVKMVQVRKGRSKCVFSSLSPFSFLHLFLDSPPIPGLLLSPICRVLI